MSWPTVPLDRCIASIRAGVSISGENRTPREGEVGILTLSAVSEGRFAPEKCKAVPAEAATALGDFVKAGTLLMSRSNTIDLVGSTALIEEDHPDRFLPDLLWEIRLREDSPLLATVLVDYLATDEGRALLRSAAMGTSGSMKKLSMGRVRALEVPEMPANLQRTWGKVRRVIEARACLVTRQIAAKRALKRGLVQQMLTARQRFPEFSARERRWRVLGEVASRVTSTWTAGDAGDTARCVELEHIESETGRLLGESVATNVSSTKTPFSRGDVLLGKLRPYLRKFAAPAFGGVCSTEIWVLRADEAVVIPSYLHLLVQTDAVQNAMHITSGSKMPRADWDLVADSAVWVPEIDEQLRITSLFDVLDRDLALLERARQVGDSQKRALMQSLLSGELNTTAGSMPRLEAAHA